MPSWRSALKARSGTSHVVKAFNNIFPHLATPARPHGAPDRSTLAIAGDDADAKSEVTELLDAVVRYRDM